MRRSRVNLTRLLEAPLHWLERLHAAIMPLLPNRDRFLFVLFLVAVGCGVLGFQASRSAVISENFGSNFLDNFYRTVQLFSFNYEVEEAWKPESGWLLLARYLAAFLTTYAVITIFARRLIERTWFWVQRKRREHHVILGFGVVGRAFARELRHRRKPVTAIDNQFDDADRAFARDHGILLVSGDLSDPETLSRARIGGARRIIVACGNDLTNVEIGTAAAAVVEAWHANRVKTEHDAKRPAAPRRFGCNAEGEPVVKVHLASTGLLADLAEGAGTSSADSGAFESFSLKTDAARALLAKARLPMRARDCGQSRVHLVIVGVGDQGEAILFSALAAGIAAGLRPPKVTLIDQCAKDVRKRLSALRPRLFDGSIPKDARPSLTFVNLDIGAVSFDLDESVLAIDHGDDPPTAWVFCSGRDELDLAAGRRLELAMHQRGRRPAPIFIRRWSARMPEELAGNADPLRLTNFFGDIANTVEKSEVLDERAFLLPKVIHDAYRGGPTAAGSPIDIDQFRQSWNRLPENVREANRSTARHIAQKLIDLGFLWRGMDNGGLPTLSAETAGACNALIDAAGEDGSSVPGEPCKATERDKILRTEHNRWLVDRAIAGWMAGPRDDKGIPRRDNRRRLHDNIRSFDELDAETRARYARPLAAAIRMFERPDIDLDARRRETGEIRLCSADVLEVHSQDPDFVGVSELIIRVGETCTTVAIPIRTTLRGLVADWAGQRAACRLLVLLEGPVESVLIDDDDEKKSFTTMEVLCELRDLLASGIIYDLARLYR